MISIFFAVLAFAFVPEFSFRVQQGGTHFRSQASVMAALAAMVCLVTLVILLRDERSGYPSSRLSVAILFWALSCVPVVMLVLQVI
jgi:drug/metabolite transporter (DMT)-like permease